MSIRCDGLGVCLFGTEYFGFCKFVPRRMRGDARLTSPFLHVQYSTGLHTQTGAGLGEMQPLAVAMRGGAVLGKAAVQKGGAEEERRHDARQRLWTGGKGGGEDGEQTGVDWRHERRTDHRAGGHGGCDWTPRMRRG